MKAKGYDISLFIHLAETIQDISIVKTPQELFSLISKAARELTGAQGAAFVLRDDDEQCYYTDEASISPLWKGQRFPMRNCISGWAMLNKQTVVVPDIYQDNRIPIDAYVSTFIKSLAIIPIRKERPIGAIGVYWADYHVATEEELKILSVLANSTATAMENMQLLSELKEANSSLKNLIKAKDEFLSIASHQLKTPLTALQIQLQLAQRRMNKDEVSQAELIARDLSSSLTHVSSLNDVIDELLDASLIRLGKLEITPTEFKINEAILNSVQRVLPELESSGCKLNITMKEEITGEWDRYRLEQVFSHLLSNMAKHAKGAQGTIEVSKKKNMVNILICDDGPGIPQEIQHKIFRRFERNGHYSHQPGLGLGLYITKNLVELHDGNLFLISTPKEGTKFIIDLPLANLESHKNS